MPAPAFCLESCCRKISQWSSPQFPHVVFGSFNFSLFPLRLCLSNSGQLWRALSPGHLTTGAVAIVNFAHWRADVHMQCGSSQAPLALATPHPSLAGIPDNTTITVNFIIGADGQVYSRLCWMEQDQRSIARWWRRCGAGVIVRTLQWRAYGCRGEGTAFQSLGLRPSRSNG